jgi:hypothetical protein
MWTRREALRLMASKLALNAILGRPDGVLEGRRVKTTATGVVWEFGPPGELLQEYVSGLADKVSGSELWRHEADADEFTGWLLTWKGAATRPIRFDDTPLRGDLWQSAEDELKRIAFWVDVKLRLEA